MPLEETGLAKKSPNMAMTEKGFSPNTMEEAWSYANRLAKTQFIPQTYQGKPDDCFIAIDISARLGIHPMMFLQNSYIVHGRPAMEAKLILSLVNASGLFTDPLDYEVEGDDPSKSDYKVRAFGKRVSTGKVLYGPWITWKLVKGENWDSKQGSKWITMPEVMFHYRAASWFTNRHCPEVKMGMMGMDEANEQEHIKHVESTELPAQDRTKFGPRTAAEGTGTEATAKDEAPDSTDGEQEEAATEGQGAADPTDNSPSTPNTGPRGAENTNQETSSESTSETGPSNDLPLYTCSKCKGSDIEPKKTSKGIVPFCMDCISGKNVVENKPVA